VNGCFALGLLEGAPRRLTVDRHDLPGNADKTRRPRGEPFLKGLEIERCENVAERVVRRRSILEGREPPEQRQLHLPEALDLRERLRPGHHRQQNKDQDLHQRIDHFAMLPRIAQFGKASKHRGAFERRRVARRVFRKFRLHPPPHCPESVDCDRFRPSTVCHALFRPIALGGGR